MAQPDHTVAQAIDEDKIRLLLVAVEQEYRRLVAADLPATITIHISKQGQSCKLVGEQTHRMTIN